MTIVFIFLVLENIQIKKKIILSTSIMKYRIQIICHDIDHLL